ncbi:Ig-like domain-containing protein [Sulfitobacter sp.]|uniref:Ig-like domain-containing protein n=1 Tax=Sulfitobacter sp. TaxID=1903071 RepID=UPI0030020FDE
MANFNLISGTDIFAGIEGETNQFFSLSADLTSADIITGSSVVGLRDRLIFTDAGTIVASSFDNVSHIEFLTFYESITVTLTENLIAASDEGVFTINASGGDDYIDASAVTAVGKTLRIDLGLGDDTYIGGAADERFSITAGSLTSGDVISAGAGYDALAFAAGVGVFAADMANVSGIDLIQLTGNNSISLVDGVAQDGTLIVQSVSGNGNVVDASGLTTDAVRFLAGVGAETLRGGGGDDTFMVNIAAGQLESGDVFEGNGGQDSMRFSTGGSILAGDLVGVSGIETFVAGSAAINMQLIDSLAVDGSIRFNSTVGDHVIDGSALSTARVIASFNNGDVTFTGGQGRDAVRMRGDQLTGADTLDGGAGDDRLRIVQGGTVTEADLANTTGFERIDLISATNFTLNDGVASGASLTVDLSNGADTFDGSAETSASLNFLDIGNRDYVIGGAADDTFVVDTDGFASVAGGGGLLNVMELGKGLAALDLTNAALSSKITDIQVIDLVSSNGSAKTLTIDAAAIAAISGAGKALYVTGASNDNVVMQGQWTDAGLFYDPAISSVPFNTYVGANGEILRVHFGMTVTAELSSAPTDLDLSAVTVAENDPGALIGAFTVTDSNAGDSFSFTVNDSRFEVDGSGQLKLTTGTTLDFEAEPTVNVIVTATDAGGLTYNETFTITVTDENEAPAVALANTVTSVAENTAVGGGLLVADIAVMDDALGTNVLDLTGTDAASFEIRGTQLYFIGASPDFETLSSYDVEVRVNDGVNPSATAPLTLAVTDVNEAPAVALAPTFAVGNTVANVVAENTAVGGGLLVARIVVMDDALGTNVLDLTGTDAASFEIRGTQLYFIGASPDFETLSSYDVEVRVNDGVNPSATALLTLAVTDVNEAPTDITLSAASVAENADGAVIGTLAGVDPDAGDSFSFTVNDSRFEVDGSGQLKLTTGSTLDFEAEPTVDVIVTATDAGGLTYNETFTITVTDENEAPAVALANTVTSVAENTAVGGGLLVADIAVMDDALGTNVLDLTGTDAASFEIRGTQLYFIGASPDFETLSSYDVEVRVNDGVNPSATAPLTLAVTDVNEAPAVALAPTFAVGNTVANVVAENTAVGGGLLVARIVVMDDALGTNVLDLTGTDAASFEIRGTQLYFIGASPDFETLSSYDVEVRVNDGVNPSATALLTLAVTDVNEAPTDITLSAASVAENADGAVIGTLAGVDPDAGDSFSFTVNDSRFEVDGSGQLKLTTGSTLDFEAEPTVDVIVTATDAGGLTYNETFTITVTDENEAPVAVADAATAIEAVVVTATGNVLTNDSDVDFGQMLAVTEVNGTAPVTGTITVIGTYGTLTLDAATGGYTYALGANDALFDGQIVTETFNYTVTDDGSGPLTASAALTVTITGTNDVPVAVADTASVTEDTQVTAVGNVISAASGSNTPGAGDAADTDVDAGAVLSVTAVNNMAALVGTAIQGEFGSLTLDADGDYTYSLGVTPKVDALKAGDVRTETFSYTITDDKGATSTTSLTVTVNGTNDTPTLAITPATGTQTSGETLIVATAADIVDPELQIASLSFDLAAVSGVLDAADALVLDAGFMSTLQLLGFNVTGDGNTSSFVISAPLGDPISPSLAETILENVKYAAGDTSFGFNAEDRTVSVTVTDGNAATSLAAVVTIDMAADVSDTGGTNVFVGANLADNILGLTGNDTITGNGGDDTIDGGDGVDTAVYSGDRADYTVGAVSDLLTGFVGSFSSVADDAPAVGFPVDEGTDTLVSIEVVKFDDTELRLDHAVQLFSRGELVATYSLIQDAIDAGVDGDTILVNGVGGPGVTAYTGNEALDIDKGVTIRGLGSVTVQSVVVSDGGAGQVVDVDNIDVAAGSSASSAIQIDDTATYASVTFQNGDVSGGTQHGLLVGTGNSTVLASNTASNVSEIAIINAAFSGNGTSPSYGSGGLTFFGFNNDITLTDVSVMGGMSTHNGIQLRGLDAIAASGNIALSGVSVNGAFVNTGVAIYNFANLDGLSFDGSGAAGSLDIDVTAAFAGLNIDGIGGDLDLAAVTGLSVANGASLDISIGALTGSGGNAFTGNDRNVALNGRDGDDVLTGGTGVDVVLGGAGADTIATGAGTDAIIQVSGEGTGDMIDGGADTDSVLLIDAAAADDTVGVVYDGTAITSLGGATLTGVEAVTAHADTTLVSGGFGALAGDAGSDTLDYTGTTVGVSVDLAAGTATGFVANLLAVGAPATAISGFENVTGGSGDDVLNGDASANIIDGGVGADTTTFSATLEAFDASGKASAVTLTATGWQVNAGGANVDTLANMEIVEHGGGSILLVGNGGYATVQAAVDAAADGDTILIANGSYAEDVVLDVAVDLIGASGTLADVTLGSIRLDAAISAAAEEITIANLTLDGSLSAASRGIVYDGSYDGTDAALAGLTFSNLDISGYGQGAVLVNGGGVTLDVALTDVTVSDAGDNGAASGTSGITLFEFRGDADFTRVSVAGNGTGVAADVDHGIQIAGFRQSDYAIEGAIGDVTFTDVSVTGTVEKTLVYVQGYNDFAGLDFTGGLELNGTATWTGLYIEPRSTVGSYAIAAAPTQIDLTGVDVTGGTYGSNPFFATTGGSGTVVFGTGFDGLITGSGSDPAFVSDVLVGMAANETISGGAGDDLIIGGGGNDSILGGDGNDSILAAANDGADVIDGGAGDDTLLIAPAAAETFTVAQNVGNGVDITVGTLSRATGIETLDINVSNGANTVILTGDLAAEGMTDVTVSGDGTSTVGVQDDAVDASGLTSGAGTTVSFDGGGGDDVFKVNDGATSNVFTAGEDAGDTDTDTLDYSAFTSGVTVDLDDSGAVTGQSATGFASVSGVEDVVGSAQADVISGDGDDNLITTGGGSDTVSGGAGDDTVVVAAGTYVFTSNADGSVTVDNGSDEVEIAADVETLTIGATSFDLTNDVRVIDAGGALVATYATIQGAVDDAATLDGMTVQLLGSANAVDFDESVSVDKALSFVGVDIGNGLPVVTSTSGDAFQLVGSIDGGTGNISFSNLTIDGAANGIMAAASLQMGALSLKDVSILNSGSYGVRVDLPADDAIVSLSVTGVGTFSGSGVNAIRVDDAVTTTTIAGDDATNRLIFADNGAGTSGGDGDISFFQFTNDASLSFLTLTGDGVGTNGVTAAGSQTGIQFRGDAGSLGTVSINDVILNGSYSRQPVAVFNYDEIDGLSVDGLTINADSTWFGTAINIDGVGGNVDLTNTVAANGATFVNLTGPNLVTNSDVFAVQGDTTGAQILEGGADNDFVRSNGGADVLIGNGGNDSLIDSGSAGENSTFDGGAGDDYTFGGTETDTGATVGEGDTALYTSTLSAANITAGNFMTPTGTSFDGWQVNATAGGEGTDLLDDIEIVQAVGGRFLLVGNGGFTTIQDAVDEAQAGDTILIASGTYAADVTVDKAVTILGLANGTDGTLHTQGNGSIVNGTMTVTAAAGAVIIDGLEFLNGTDENTTFNGLVLSGAADITVSNNLFYASNAVGNGLNPNQDRALYVNTAATGDIDITGNLITGASVGKYSTAAWHRAIWSDGAAATLDITENTINSARTAMNLDSFDNATSTISNNEIQNVGSGIAVGVGSDSTLTSITDNVFTDVDTDFNLGNLNTSVVFDAGTTGNTAGASATDSFDVNGTMVILGGSVGDDLDGTDGADIILGNLGDDTIDGDAGSDWLQGGGGADVLSGGIGADAIDGGTENDQLNGDAGDDYLRGGTGADTIDSGAGSDTVYGTDGAGDEANTAIDTATYAAGAGVTWNDTTGNWEVTEGGDTDILYGIETVTIAGQTYQLVDDDATQGGFSSVSEAQAAAVDGDIILVAGGSYAGATITKAVTVMGMGEGSTAADTVFTSGFSLALDGDKAAGTVGFENLAITAASGVGINADAANKAILGTLNIEDARIEGGNSHGLLVSGRKASAFYDQAGVQNVIVTDSAFVDNAQVNQNVASLFLYEFDGNATITDVTVSNAVTGANSAAYLVQMAGFDGPRYDQKAPASGYVGGSYDVLTAMGAVVIDGLDVTGESRKVSFYVQGYTDMTGLTITGSTVDTVSGWGKPVIIDPMADQLPSGTPNDAGNGGSFFNETGANGSYDLSGLTVTQTGIQFNEVQGTTQNDTITSSNANDEIVGFAGNDVLNGGGGADTFIFDTDDGTNTVDGGAGDDTVRATATDEALSGFNVSETSFTEYTASGYTVNHSNVETIELVGSGSNNSFSFLEKSLDAVPLYDVDGYTGTDTLNFLNYTDNATAAAVTVSLIGGTFSQTGATPVHSVTNVENVNGSGASDFIIGDNLTNQLVGSGGNDTINGLGGNDTIVGGSGNDELFGGDGQDLMVGGAGADLLNGGTGPDQFRYDHLSEGTSDGLYDLILSFSTAENDEIVISRIGSGFEGLSGGASGYLDSDNFVNSGVAAATGQYFGGNPGLSTFVLDDSGSNGLRALWYDDDGDGFAVKMVEFNTASNLSAFDEDSIFLDGTFLF